MGMVHKGGNAVPFHGDHHPVGIYVGDKPIFEPTYLAKDGKTITFENTYNDVTEVTVFGESTQETMSGKNLFNEEWLTLNVNNSPFPFVWDNTEQAYVGNPASMTQWDLPIAYKEGATYTVSWLSKRAEEAISQGNIVTDGFGLGLHVFYTDGSYRYVAISKNTSYTLSSYTTKSDSTVREIKLTYNHPYVSYVKWIQIELGDAVTSYEPYCGGIPSPNPDYPQPIESIKSVELVSRNADGSKSAARTIDLQGHELRSLPDGTNDELLVHRDGTVELVQRVGYRLVKNFNGASPWGKNTIFIVYLGRKMVETTSTTSESNFNRALCSIGLTNSRKVYYSETNKPGYIVHDAFSNLESSEYLFFFLPNLGSIDDANEYAASNPIDVQFVLDTPQTIQLPSIDPLPTYHPYTFVDGNGADISARVRVFLGPTSKILDGGGK